MGETVFIKSGRGTTSAPEWPVKEIEMENESQNIRVSKREAVLLEHVNEHFLDGFAVGELARSLGWPITKVKKALQVCYDQELLEPPAVASGRHRPPRADVTWNGIRDLLDDREFNASKMSKIFGNPWGEDEETGEVPVGSAVLIRRINRALATMMLKLFVAQDERQRADLGAYYVADRTGKHIEDKHVDVEVLARELEALKPWERLA